MFPPLPDDMHGRCVKNGHNYKVTVVFALLREGLREVEGEWGGGSKV